ncbi:PLC-like phosphodiesterase, partial [Zopfochytrium polystomum]
LRFPHALMSHRGGSLELIENTLPAFRRSANVLKVDLLELDVQMTKDGQIVIFHDGDMGRLCGLPGKRIRDFDYAELPPLLIPEPVKDAVLAIDGPDTRRIPLLEELLNEFPKYPMQIDVKDASEEMVIKVGGMIRRYNRQNETVWGSFIDSVQQLCYSHFRNEIPLFFSLRRGLRSYILSLFGLTRWMRYRESALIVPNLWWLMSRSWFRALNSLGIAVIVFGSGTGSINSIEGYERVRRAGGNGICTDRPSLLKEWLMTNKL